METVQRIGVSLEPELLKSFDRFIGEKGYSNRSEAIRDLIRNALVERQWGKGRGRVLGTITMVYDHHTHGVTEQLLELQHHSDVDISATLHVHVDEHNCLEVLVVSGKGDGISRLASSLESIRGVKHVQLSRTSARFKA